MPRWLRLLLGTRKFPLLPPLSPAGFQSAAPERPAAAERVRAERVDPGRGPWAGEAVEAGWAL